VGVSRLGSRGRGRRDRGFLEEKVGKGITFEIYIKKISNKNFKKENSMCP
jgi:hypothetical protein